MLAAPLKRALKRHPFYLSFRDGLIRFCWRRAALYRWMKICRGRRFDYDDTCDLVFDGYPRSANTYGSQMLALSQRGRLKVETHCHRPPFLLHALQRDKMVCLTIRRPVESIASRRIYAEGELAYYLHEYANFYAVLRPYLGRILVLPFPVITGDFSLVLRLIERRFGLPCEIPADLEACRREALRRIDDMWRDEHGRVIERQVARPCPSRDAINAALQNELRQPRYRELVARCEDIYELLHREFERSLALLDQGPDPAPLPGLTPAPSRDIHPLPA
jgi:hypothetical protein